jgi:arabinogalactan oligomer / maltooligosaccharide transport system permease protein
MVGYLITAIIVFLLIILNFVMQSISVEIAEKKGLNKFKAGFIGLIPIYGIIHYLRVPSVKGEGNVSNIKMTYSLKEILIKFLIYTQLLSMVIIVLIPIVYILGASLTDVDNLPIRIWPKNISWNNYTDLLWGDDVYVKGEFFENLKNIFWGHLSNDNKFKGEVIPKTIAKFFSLNFRADFIQWYFNTLGIALINMIVGTVFITGAAYVFARYKFKGKRAGMITILVLQVFPSFMGLIAMYVLFNTFGLLGRPLWLSVLYIGGAIPFNMWVIKGYLMNIPRELDESAMIDGANKLHIFFKIIMPLSVPIISFVAVNLFMAPWMDYMLPSYLLEVTVGDRDPQSQLTIAVGLFNMISGTNSEYTKFAAGAVIVALPITVLYMVFQRFLVEGITAGSTKG